jgi:hypothetical protein
MRNAVVTSMAVAGVAIAMGLTARGQVQPVPGPGSGVVTVTGIVQSSQNGDWKVDIANVPSVRVVETATVTRASLPFLKTGTRVTVMWQDGTQETIRIGQLGSGGWVLDDSSRRRWLNLDSARSVEDAK